jgi:alcohol dehydrogenase class IV
LSAFTFNSVGSVLVEDGAASRLGQILQDRFAPKHILLVTDAGLVKLGLVAPVLASCEAAGIAVTVFDGVEADPSEATVQKAALVAKSYHVSVVVGFGGGSSMDVAKLVAVLGNTGPERPSGFFQKPMNTKLQSLADIYGIDQVKGTRLPLVQVPTTAGTGSEVTPVAIVTTGEHTKMGVVSSRILADLAVLDAELTLGLPAHITAATGIDAMVHAVEAYTSAIKKNPVSDAVALQALRLLGDNIVTVCKDGSDLDARRAMLTGAMLAGAAFANAPVAAVHALAYPIGGRFHVPHGLSNALVLPYVLRFNAEKAPDLYGELARHVGQGETATDFINWLERIADAVGIERRLRDVGIVESDLPTLADDAMLQTRLLVNNPREVGYDDALAIYEAAW